MNRFSISMDDKLRRRLLEILKNPEEYPEEYEAIRRDEMMEYRKDDPMHPGPPGSVWF